MTGLIGAAIGTAIWIAGIWPVAYLVGYMRARRGRSESESALDSDLIALVWPVAIVTYLMDLIVVQLGGRLFSPAAVARRGFAAGQRTKEKKS